MEKTVLVAAVAADCHHQEHCQQQKSESIRNHGTPNRAAQQTRIIEALKASATTACAKVVARARAKT